MEHYYGVRYACASSAGLSMHALLVMFKGDGTRRDFPIQPDRKYIIGRNESSDLRIPLSEVSRSHAAVYFDEEEDELVVEDLGSSNGTYVNNEQIESKTKVDLCPGDVIVVGQVPFQVVIDGYPADIHPIKLTGAQSGVAAAAAAADQKTTVEGAKPAATPSPADSDGITLSGNADLSDDDSFFDFDLDDSDI